MTWSCGGPGPGSLPSICPTGHARGLYSKSHVLSHQEKAVPGTWGLKEESQARKASFPCTGSSSALAEKSP